MAYDRFDSKTHAGVLSFFNEHYIKTDKIEKTYAKMIARAEKIRIQSDYDDFYMASKQQAQDQVKDAEKFLVRIEEFINGL